MIDNTHHFSVLYAEDEKALQQETAAFFKKLFAHVDVADNGKEALALYTKNTYDLVITDISMPLMNGLELIEHIRAIHEEQEVIVISAHTDTNYLSDAIALHVSGYIIKPMHLTQLLKVIQQSIDKLMAFRENETYKSTLEIMVDNRTKQILLLQEQLVDNYDKAIHSMVKMIEERDPYTGGHSERVALYSRDIAKEMGFSDEEGDLVYQAGILHDIGKVITPDAILLKPGKLTESEYALIKEHVTVGYNLLSEVPMYHEIAKIIHGHHERHDGSGYPLGISGEDIPVYSRIMSIADTFDAMTTSRVYKAKKSVPKAIEELRLLGGTWFDPLILEVALNVLEKVNVEAVIPQEVHSPIDNERFAYFYKDLLTGAYNHYYLDFILKKNQEQEEACSLEMLYLKNFSTYNKKYGWGAGDKILKTFVEHLKERFPDAKIFRIFGDDFAILRKEEKPINIDAINALPFLKKANINCQYKDFNEIGTSFALYKELEEV